MSNVVTAATELVTEFVKQGHYEPEQARQKIRETVHWMFQLETKGKAGLLLSSEADWKQSVKPTGITCLECNTTMDALDGRHLRKHGMTKEQYRTKHGIPNDQPLTTEGCLERQRSIIQKSQPWNQKTRV